MNTLPNKSRVTVICGCGCNVATTLNKCEFVRRMWQGQEEGSGTIVRKPGLVTWTIRKECRAAFENELGMINAVDVITRVNLGRNWFRRLAVAAQLYDLQCDIFRRNRGDAGARKVAWQSVRLFLVPQWPWLIKRLTLKPSVDEIAAG